MPDFTHPWILMLLFAVPPLLWHWRRRNRASIRYSAIGLAAGLPARRAAWARHGGLGLRALGCIVLVVGLAGPRWPDEGTRIPVEGVSIAVVLDVSASMGEIDFPWQERKISRLDGAKRILRGFVVGGESQAGAPLEGRPQDLVALVSFAARPETACPLTLDHRTLLQIADAQEPRIAVDVGTTNPGDALAWALHVLKKAPTIRRSIVFLSDGEANVPRGLKPRQAAQLAANMHVPIYALDAAPDPDPGEDPGDAKKARETMETIARMTGGAYFRAADPQALADACRELDRLHRSVIESFSYRRHHEGFAWFAVGALVCWTLVLAVESTVWRTTP